MLLAAEIIIAFGLLVFLLTRDRPSKYDLPEGQRFRPADQQAAQASADALKVINQRLLSAGKRHENLSLKQRAYSMRETMDSFFASEETVSRFTPVDAGGVPAEWVIAPGSDSDRRFLYIHGGAFMAGSPLSHRVITSKLSEVTGCVVLSIDYRLMPEHGRLASVEDCRSAYQWLLRNSPDSSLNSLNAPKTGANDAPEPSVLFVAGDSAGGNLTLSLLAWVRDNQLPAPNAAVALSPITDSRFTSPSIRSNLDSDVMLKPLAKRFTWMPGVLISLAGRFLAGHKASDPVVSPLLGDLSGLPPILVLASDCEILRDDGRRYVNKAVEAGTDATLQLWDNVPHVWPIFYPHLPEAGEAFDQIEAFCKRHG